MLYQRSRQIEDRLDTLLRLIHSGRYSTPGRRHRAEHFHPDRLQGHRRPARGRGYRIRAVRENNTWYYALEETDQAEIQPPPHEPGYPELSARP